MKAPLVVDENITSRPRTAANYMEAWDLAITKMHEFDNAIQPEMERARKKNFEGCMVPCSADDPILMRENLASFTRVMHFWYRMYKPTKYEALVRPVTRPCGCPGAEPTVACPDYVHVPGTNPDPSKIHKDSVLRLLPSAEDELSDVYLYALIARETFGKRFWKAVYGPRKPEPFPEGELPVQYGEEEEEEDAEMDAFDETDDTVDWKELQFQ